MSACTRRSDCASWVHYPECPAKFTDMSGKLDSLLEERQPPPDFSDGGKIAVLPAKQELLYEGPLRVKHASKEYVIFHETPTPDGPEFDTTTKLSLVGAFGGGTPDSSAARETLIEPDEVDEDRWYRIQTWGAWYAIRACCRSCATRKLHAWVDESGVRTVEMPDWLMSL